MIFLAYTTYIRVGDFMYIYKEGILDLQPREKASKYGIINLSDRELISVILGSGTKDAPIDVLSSKILRIIDEHNGNVSTRDLMEIKGIGKARAIQLKACLEFSRRIIGSGKIRVSYPSDTLPEVRHFVTRQQEYFIVISLNGAHEIIKSRVVSIGILNKTLIHPREVFSDPIKERAASVILAHNHPSGNLQPSPEDIEVTKRLVKAGEILGIGVLDHIIFSSKEHYSFAENSLL